MEVEALEEEVRLQAAQEEALRVAHGRTGRRRVVGHIHLVEASAPIFEEGGSQRPIPI